MKIFVKSFMKNLILLFGFLPQVVLAAMYDSATNIDAIKNTASNECVAFMANYKNTLSTYWTIPNGSNLQRVDVLTPTLYSADGFQGIQGTSTQTITYYATSSTYFNADGTVRFALSKGGANTFITTESYIPVGDQASRIYFRHTSSSISSCAVGTKISLGYGIYFYPTNQIGSPYSVPTQIAQITTPQLQTICSDTSKTFQDLYLSNPTLFCLGNDPVTCIDKLKAATSSETVAKFCGLWE